MSTFSDPIELSIADKGLRFVNYFIDKIIINIFFYSLFFGMIYLESLNDEFIDFFMFAYFGFSLGFPMILYTGQEYFMKGRTIGKFITGTVVVRADGNELTFTNCLVRSLCRLIPLEEFSFLFANFGWHDAISGTRVVKKKRFEELKIKYESRSMIEQIGGISEDEVKSAL